MELGDGRSAAQHWQALELASAGCDVTARSDVEGVFGFVGEDVLDAAAGEVVIGGVDAGCAGEAIDCAVVGGFEGEGDLAGAEDADEIDVLVVFDVGGIDDDAGDENIVTVAADNAVGAESADEEVAELAGEEFIIAVAADLDVATRAAVE